MASTVAAPPAQLNRVALEAFERIASTWGLTLTEQRALLGAIPRSTYDRWRRHPDQSDLSADTLERVSHVLGIYKALHVLFSDRAYADRWICEPNTRFAGASAKDYMLGSFTQLVELRRYLDGVRGA